VSQGERLLPAMQRTLYACDQPRKDVLGRGFIGYARVTELLDGLYQQRVTVYDNVTRVLAANQEFYPLTTVSVTQLVPILEQPATVPSGVPPTNAIARITVYTPTTQTVYPTPSSYLTRLASWTSVERESAVTIGQNGLVPYGSPAVIRERFGRISYYNNPWSNPESSTSVTVGGVTTTVRATYIDDPAAWLIGQLDTTQERSWDKDDVQPEPRTIDRDYDTAGRLFRVTREPSATNSLWQQTEVDYDLVGQPWPQDRPRRCHHDVHRRYLRAAPEQCRHRSRLHGSGRVRPCGEIVYREGGKDTLYHLSGDFHGSVSLVLNDELKVLERRYTEPFGGRVAEDGEKLAPSASAITRGFTGHEEERSLGLINMRGRIYDPAQRRFLTPDPFVPQPLLSQSYNRYS
jgi:RHS repeat-associated protein